MDEAGLPGAEEARRWIGSKLDEMGGATAGRVDGILVDAVDGTPTWVIAKLGRFGRRSAVPFEFVAAGAGHVWVPYERETLRSAAELDPSAGLSSGEERALSAAYGLPAGSGRLAAISERLDEEPGSVPVERSA